MLWQLVLSLVLLVVLGACLRLADKVILRRLTANGVDVNLVQLIRRVLIVFGIVIVVMTILETLNVPITAFAFVSGAIAIGIGFGAQNIINNFISGWILMWERPIRIGDFIELGETRGTVESINTRSTRIRRVDGVHLLVPNSYLLENTVVNWTLVDRLTRTFVRVGVAYGSPVEKVAQLLREVAAANTSILPDPKPLIIFEDFGDNSLIFDTVFWVEAGGDKDLRVVRSALRFSISEIFAANNIVIAFPQRDVHIDSLSPIEVTVVGNGTEKG